MFGRRRNQPRAPRGPLDRLKGSAYQDDGGRTAYAVLFGVLAFVMVTSVAVWQITAESTGRQLIENGVATLTDIDVVIAEQRQALHTEAVSGGKPVYTIPGYPLDVYLSPDEIQRLSDADLRNLILDRSSAIIYGQGLGAFDRTGDQSLSLFSSGGVLKRIVGMINQDNHDHARLAAIAAAIATALVAVMLASRNEGFRRVRALGTPLFIAGLVGSGLTLLAGLGIDRWWGGDPFGDDVNTLFHDTLSIAMRDFLVVAGLGAFLFVVGLVCQLIARRISPSADGADEDYYDAAYDAAYDDEYELG